MSHQATKPKSQAKPSQAKALTEGGDLRLAAIPAFDRIAGLQDVYLL